MFKHLLCVVVFASFGAAHAGFEAATSDGEDQTGDIMLTRCFDSTLGGFRFSIVRRGICPFQVLVDPESGEVRLR